MNAPEINKKIYSYIEEINDESQLQMLNDVAEVYATKKRIDILDLLTSEQLERLNKSIKQVEQKKTISHNEVKTLSQEWLGKQFGQKLVVRL